LASKLTSEAHARNDRKARLVRLPSIIVIVGKALDGLVVVGVVDIEIRRETPVLELPGLVDAQVQLVKER
jgi:hypothetical protein